MGELKKPYATRLFRGSGENFRVLSKAKISEAQNTEKSTRNLANITKPRCFLLHKFVQNVAEGVGFEPTCPEGKRFSRPPRYDHFDNPP